MVGPAFRWGQTVHHVHSVSGAAASTDAAARRRGVPLVGAWAMLALAALIGVLSGCSGSSAASAFTPAPPGTRLRPSVAPDPLPPLSRFVTLSDGSQVSTVSADYLFDPGSDQLRPAAVTALQQILPQIREHDGHIEVIGYSDGVGSPDYNLGLSERRAAAVERWLLAQDIPQAALRVIGKGEDGARNDVPDSTRRRVEIVLK
jgi:OmpA-OmpF porin, OOP family